MDIYTILLISLKNNLNLNDGNFLIKLILSFANETCLNDMPTWIHKNLKKSFSISHKYVMNAWYGCVIYHENINTGW